MADTLVYTSEKALRDAGDKVPAADKKEIEGKIEELKKIKDGEDISAIRQKTQELSAAIQKIGSALYGQQPAGGQADQPANSQTEEKKKPEAGDVVEGEVEDNPKKK